MPQPSRKKKGNEDTEDRAVSCSTSEEDLLFLKKGGVRQVLKKPKNRNKSIKIKKPKRQLLSYKRKKSSLLKGKKLSSSKSKKSSIRQ